MITDKQKNCVAIMKGMEKQVMPTMNKLSAEMVATLASSAMFYKKQNPDLEFGELIGSICAPWISANVEGLLHSVVLGFFSTMHQLDPEKDSDKNKSGISDDAYKTTKAIVKAILDNLRRSDFDLDKQTMIRVDSRGRQ